MITQGFGFGMGLILQGLVGWIEELVKIIGGIVRPHIPRHIDFVPTQPSISFRPTSPRVNFITRRK